MFNFFKRKHDAEELEKIVMNYLRYLEELRSTETPKSPAQHDDMVMAGVLEDMKKCQEAITEIDKHLTELEKAVKIILKAEKERDGIYKSKEGVIKL